MKKSRPEQLQTYLEKYLQRRQYPDPDSPKKQQLRLTQSVQDLALSGVLDNALCLPNVVLFGSPSVDAASEQQFIRFKNRIAEAPESIRVQLSQLLFPIFVHLYLELILSGQKAAAVKFHKRHSGLFSANAHDRDVSEALASVGSHQELENNHKIRVFWKSLYEVKLTDAAYHYLMRYLHEDNHLLLIQLINSHVLLNVSNVPEDVLRGFQEEKEEGAAEAARRDPEDEERGHGPTKVKEESEFSPEDDAGAGEAQMLRLRVEEAIRAVRKGPSPLPAVCLYTFHNPREGICAAATDPRQQVLAAGSEMSTIRLWSLVPGKLVPSAENGAEIHRVRLACDLPSARTHDSAKKSACETQVLRGHGDAVQSLSFSPVQSVLLSASRDTSMRAWNLSNFECLAIYRGHNYPIWSVDASPFGFYVATGSMDRSARLWMLDRTYPLRVFAGHTMDVDKVKFHPNSNYLATGSVDRTVRLWSVTDGNMCRVFPGHRGAVFALAFSPDGKFLASAGEDRRIKVWDLGMGSAVKEFRGHTDIVYDLAWNCDGSILVSCGMDSGLRFWDFLRSSATKTTGRTSDAHPSPELLGIVNTNTSCLLHLDYSQEHSVICAATGL